MPDRITRPSRPSQHLDVFAGLNAWTADRITRAWELDYNPDGYVLIVYLAVDEEHDKARNAAKVLTFGRSRDLAALVHQAVYDELPKVRRG